MKNVGSPTRLELYDAILHSAFYILHSHIYK